MAAGLVAIREQLGDDAHTHLTFAIDEVLDTLHDQLFPTRSSWLAPFTQAAAHGRHPRPP